MLRRLAVITLCILFFLESFVVVATNPKPRVPTSIPRIGLKLKCKIFVRNLQKIIRKNTTTSDFSIVLLTLKISMQDKFQFVALFKQ